ncbi:hypothetical protein [Massilia sp. DD77]|uniref:hypothetical protein n=1 Tax=Massilia sp. DD77 TaxID=3109349 RepID=UPI002FFE9A8F
METKPMMLEAWLFICTAVLLGLGCLVPNSWLPPLPNDKLLHFAGFAVLTALAMRLAQERQEALLWLAGLLLGGLLVECLQALVPERRFCWRDMGANAAGIAAVALPVFLYGPF